MPKLVVDHLEKIQRDFLRGGGLLRKCLWSGIDAKYRKENYGWRSKAVQGPLGLAPGDSKRIVMDLRKLEIKNKRWKQSQIVD